MKRVKISDAAEKIGSYEIVKDLPLSTITKNAADDGEKLDGLIIRGYETKFSNGVNENGERYTRESVDRFIEKYFVGNGLNMPVTIQHKNDVQHLAGRVLILEVNTIGFYFVAYIPRTYWFYNEVCNLLKNGILQGFSKEGYAIDPKPIRNDAGEWIGWEINDFELLCVSLVATPANGVPFEKMQEVTKDGLRFKKEEAKNTITKEEEERQDPFDDMFN